MGKPKWTSVVQGLLDLLQIAIAIGVVVLTSWRLLNVKVDNLNFDSSCVLDGSGSTDAISGTRFCAYAIAVGIVSLLVSVIFGCVRNVFKCVTLDACAASQLVSLLGDALLAIWWGVAFALFVKRGTAANDIGLPNRTERDGVIALGFGGTVVFALDALITIWTFVKS